MAETTRIRKIGNSLGIYLDKGVLNKVYHLDERSEVKVEYGFAGIVIKPVPPAEAQS